MVLSSPGSRRGLKCVAAVQLILLRWLEAPATFERPKRRLQLWAIRHVAREPLPCRFSPSLLLSVSLSMSLLAGLAYADFPTIDQLKPTARAAGCADDAGRDEGNQQGRLGS